MDLIEQMQEVSAQIKAKAALLRERERQELEPLYRQLAEIEEAQEACLRAAVTRRFKTPGFVLDVCKHGSHTQYNLQSWEQGDIATTIAPIYGYTGLCIALECVGHNEAYEGSTEYALVIGLKQAMAEEAALRAQESE